MKVENTAGIGFDIGQRGHLRMDGTFVQHDGVVLPGLPEDLVYSPAVIHLEQQGALKRIFPHMEKTVRMGRGVGKSTTLDEEILKEHPLDVAADKILGEVEPEVKSKSKKKTSGK